MGMYQVMIKGDDEMIETNKELLKQAEADVMAAHQNTDWYSGFDKLLSQMTYVDVLYPNIQTVALKVIKAPLSTETVDRGNQPTVSYNLSLVLTYAPDTQRKDQLKTKSFVEKAADTNTDITDEIIASKFIRNLLSHAIFGGRIGFARLTQDTITLRRIIVPAKRH
jgi:hypothetical protein